MRLTSFLFALLLIGTAAQAADPVTPTQCGPGPGGSPCDGSGPASQGNSSDTEQGAGNPINVITGNKYQQEVDLPALPGVLGLEIVRHYNSSLADARTPPGITGRGWKLSYETDLYPIGNTLQIVQADGTRIIFVRDPKNPSQCATNNPAHGTLRIHKTPSGEEYVWTWTNGRTLSFNHQGKLTEIRAPTGEFVSLTRDIAGALVKVTDPQGRSLVLGYPQRRSPDRFNGVTHIDSPVGRFSYAYGSAGPKGHAGNPRDLLANLVRVDLPGAIRRHYHFEDPSHPTLLTGISVAGQGAKPQRVSTYAYDPQGRGILSVRGEPKRLGKNGKPVSGTGIEQVILDFEPGKTVLTNSLGQTTTYTHAIVGNEYRLLKVTGVGCANCGEINIKYDYDKLGRLTEATKLSPTGQPLATTRTERDTLGRPIRISRVVYHKGRAQPARLQVRYEYAGQSLEPSLIARPSVIAGREAVTRITWNDHGQPARIIESGFSPLDHKGQANPTPIARTTTYAYRSINGRSLLAQIDGPLSNGKTNSPADSDITRLEWDRSGSAVVVMTPPGGFSSTMQYDAAGRIAEVSNTENFKTTFTYDAANRLIQTASSAQNWEKAGIKPVVQRYRYDALGHMIETGSGGPADAADKTEHHEGPYRPQTRKAFDVAGRLLWQAEALGILKHARYDTEGNLLASTVQTRSFEQTEQYRYDAFNRLIQVADTTGSVRNVVYGKVPDAQRPRRQSAFQTLKDDFGRTVRIASASHGSTIRQYNAADQLVQHRTDKGDIQTYAYDLTGQRIRHTIQPKTGEGETTTWRYEQRRLVEANDPVQTERIRYNGRGLPEAKTVTLKLANGAEATYITHYSYTADGSLHSQSLPDGTKIRYERNGQGQVVAVSQQTSPSTFFGWGKTTLVKDMERDLIGLRHVTYGNGIQGQWQRSKQGVLARVVYTQPEGRAVNPSSVVAAAQAAVRQTTLGSILDKLLPAAHAQTPPSAASTLPGALGLPADPQALFDARLLYDGAGNVLLQKQQGQGLQHTQTYAYDRQSQLIAVQSASPSSPVNATSTAGEARVWRYYYDRNGNRVLSQENVPVTEMGHTRKAIYDLTSNALTTQAGLGREYVWNAQGQLIAIRQENRELARYRYNHQGLRVGKQTGAESTYTLYNEARQRIADLDANGRITRQHLWLGDHLIATLDARQPKALQAPADGFWKELTQTARALWQSATGQTDRLAFVHVNHLGAPIAATNQAGQILWQADYAPYGNVIKVGAVRLERIKGQRPAYTLALRLPGQWEDSESGLYYNDFRYYDPRSGRYLSPDPLGRMAERLGSSNAYAYVNNNPLSYVDPWGLILFAFDGTENTDDQNWLDAHDSSPSNVLKFSSLYASDNGQSRYITGVGVIHKDLYGYDDIHAPLLDAGVNWSGPERIERMVEYFKDEADAFDDGIAMDIDIIGFSRGSAQARDFANRINANTINGAYRYVRDGQQRCQKLNFRFMGLWDTVLSDNWSGRSYKLGIVPGFQYAAQAVALNEFRYHTLPLGRAKPWDTHSWGGFPLESIMGGTVPVGQTRIERGFIGAHADIGGGFGPNENQLAQVALAWMVDQADAAGVNMKNDPKLNTIIANPVIHDKSDAIRFGSPKAGSPIVNDNTWDNDYDIPTTSIPGSGAEDREVRYRDDNGNITTKTIQREMTGTGMTFGHTEQFITYTERSDLPKNAFGYTTNQTGTVDMQGYLKWLNDNGYGLTNLTVQ
ncbi:MAG: RHS repeat-associated core domain-containing protein [Thiobacillus sp.]